MTFTFQSARLDFDQQFLNLLPNQTNSEEALYVDFTTTNNSGNQKFQVFIHPKRTVTLKSFELRFAVPLSQNSEVFYNGFLPNHRSGTHRISAKIAGQGWLTSKTGFHQQAPAFSTAKSSLSWHYGYAGAAQDGLFLGSLNETTAFTAIEYDAQQQQIIVRKDIAGLELGHSFPLLDLMVSIGNKATSLAAYFSEMKGTRFPAPPLTGWMANKKNNGNSASAINHFLSRRKEENITADLVLIGSGYAKEAGDWLFSGDQFPDGLPPLIAEIKAAGLKVGMSISPLLCNPNSDIYRQHPDWVLKDIQNKPISIKTNTGVHYVLDAYETGVQDYLQVFCYTVTTQWGIDLLKFDNLSTAFATARKTKTRAQAINDFVKMLRSSCPDTLIWATGLPMATGWSYANYTATASTIIENWDTRFPLLYANPDAATARIQLKNIIQRNNNAEYGIAANLITLTPSKVLTETQQHTILFINALFSDIVVISDAPESLSSESWSEWQLVEGWKSAKVTKVVFANDETCVIDFKNKEGAKFRGLVNLGNEENSLEGITLRAGETLVLANEKR